MFLGPPFYVKKETGKNQVEIGINTRGFVPNFAIDKIVLNYRKKSTIQ